MTNAEALQINIDAFPWSSEVQREGFLNYAQYLRDFGVDLGCQLTTAENLAVLYFIQKDHESNEYWRELVGTQVTDLQNQLRTAMQDIEMLRESVLQLSETVRLLTRIATTEVKGDAVPRGPQSSVELP